jgi:N-carbamoylputrescine amidase
MTCRVDKDYNVKKALRLARLAAKRGAQLICFQELLSTHWFPREINDVHFALAEDVDGPTIDALRKFAREHTVSLICPIFERDGDAYYNSAVVLDAHGSLIGTYRKVHVPQIPLWEERSYFSPGNDGFPVFDIDSVKIGVQICWDNFFPEGSRSLALQGAQIIFAPTAAAFASQQRWLKVMAGNAIANGVYVLRVNRVGSEAKQDFYGMSFCLSPEGELLGEPSGMNEGILLVDISPAETARVQKEWPFFRDRRPELYTSLTDQRRHETGA